MAFSPGPVKKFLFPGLALKITMPFRSISISQFKYVVSQLVSKTLIKKAQTLVDYVGKIIINQRKNDFSLKHLGSCLTLPVLGNL